MGLLDALLRGATGFLKPLYQGAKVVVRDILQEIDRSEIGKALTSFVAGAASRMQGRASDLRDEEAELAAKRQRDGRQSEYDAHRQQEIQKERERMRAEMDRESALKAAAELREKVDELSLHEVDDDEISASVGIMAHKNCPNCGGLMRIRQRGRDANTNRTTFYWQCTVWPGVCKAIVLDPFKESFAVVRKQNTDLDLPKEERQAAWNEPQTIQVSHGRLRGHLGEDDEKMTCPVHLLPMKLLPVHRPGGRLLDSYAYTCLGVMPDGTACPHTVKVEKMAQVSATLQRSEGRGILH